MPIDTGETIGQMHTLGPPDTHFLSAALGWFELGNIPEAKAELGRIGPAANAHPDVLEVRWLLCAEERNWDEALRVARTLIEVAPQRSSAWLHRAYALRRVKGGGVSAAWDALSPAVEKFPTEPTIPYNLACYACQRGQLDQARHWLARAIEVGGKEKIKIMALNDEDLEPLWEEIKRS